MILAIFLTFLALSMSLLIFGYFMENDLMRIIGLVMLYLCSATLSPAIPSPLGDLEIQTGLTETVTDNTTTTTYTYEPYTNHISSFYLIAFAILMSAQLWFTRKEARG